MATAHATPVDGEIAGRVADAAGSTLAFNPLIGMRRRDLAAPPPRC